MEDSSKEEKKLEGFESWVNSLSNTNQTQKAVKVKNIRKALFSIELEDPESPVNNYIKSERKSPCEKDESTNRVFENDLGQKNDEQELMKSKFCEIYPNKMQTIMEEDIARLESSIFSNDSCFSYDEEENCISLNQIQPKV